jgi:hypothetical protein
MRCSTAKRTRSRSYILDRGQSMSAANPVGATQPSVALVDWLLSEQFGRAFDDLPDLGVRELEHHIDPHRRRPPGRSARCLPAGGRAPCRRRPPQPCHGVVPTNQPGEMPRRLQNAGLARPLIDRADGTFRFRAHMPLI